MNSDYLKYLCERMKYLPINLKNMELGLYGNNIIENDDNLN